MTIADVQQRIDQILVSFAPPQRRSSIRAEQSAEQADFDTVLSRASLSDSRRLGPRQVAAGDPPAMSPVLRDLFASAADRYGIDVELLMAVSWTESGFQPDAESAAGAIGLMQLMPDTAEWLGVDPHDIVENIDGGAKFLRHLIDRFGRLDLVLAAYNAGPGAVEAAGGVPSIRETQRYVPLVLSRLQALQEASGSPTLEAPNGLEWAYGLVSPPAIAAPPEVATELTQPALSDSTRSSTNATERLVDVVKGQTQPQSATAGSDARPTIDSANPSLVPAVSETLVESSDRAAPGSGGHRQIPEPAIEGSESAVDPSSPSDDKGDAETAASLSETEPAESGDRGEQEQSETASQQPVLVAARDSAGADSADGEIDTQAGLAAVSTGPAAAAPSATVRSAPPLAPARIPDLVATMAQRGGNQTLTFEFDPPDLGDVRVQVIVRGETVTVNITTRNDEASLAVEQLRQRIERSLDTEGFHLDEFDVANQSDSERQRRREQHRDLEVPRLLANVEAEIESVGPASSDPTHSDTNIIRL